VNALTSLDGKMEEDAEAKEVSSERYFLELQIFGFC